MIVVTGLKKGHSHFRMIHFGSLSGAMSELESEARL